MDLHFLNILRILQVSNNPKNKIFLVVWLPTKTTLYPETCIIVFVLQKTICNLFCYKLRKRENKDSHHLLFHPATTYARCDDDKVSTMQDLA
jgi:hypothetical protein